MIEFLKLTFSAEYSNILHLARDIKNSQHRVHDTNLTDNIDIYQVNILLRTLVTYSLPVEIHSGYNYIIEFHLRKYTLTEHISCLVVLFN